MRQIVVALLHMMLFHASFAQSKIHWFSELGVNSGFTVSSKEENGFDKRSEKTEGLLSPLVGAWVGLYQSRHLYFNLGVQFNWTGRKFTEERQSYDYLNDRIYNTKEVEELKVYKLSFPIILGYQGSIRKLKIRGFGGYKMVQYASGRYEIETSGPDYHLTKSYNPFNNRDLDIRARRNTDEYTVGAGFFLNPRMEVITSFSTGGFIYFAEKNGTSPSSNGYSHRYSASDLSVTVRYLMNSTNKKDKHESHPVDNR